MGPLQTASGIIYLGSSTLTIGSLLPLQMAGSSGLTQSLAQGIVPLQSSLMPTSSLSPQS